MAWRFARVINAMRKSRQPIICRVQGKAVGGGVGIMAASDFCFATEAADLKLSELSLGIGPFVIGPAIERNCLPLRFFRSKLFYKGVQEEYQYDSRGIPQHAGQT